MRKIILTVLMVVILATPSFAQEINTNNLFSIENTFWSVFPPDGSFFGFANGRPYHCYTVIPVLPNYLSRNYICKEGGDYVDSYPVSSFSLWGIFYSSFYGDLQPLLGIGILHEIESDGKGTEEYLGSSLLLKIGNHWTPDTDPIMCGGIAGLHCPKNMICIDDPRDYCRWGNPDCSGFCVYGF